MAGITLHKAGKYILFKANDYRSALILNEIKLRAECSDMKSLSYYTGKTSDYDRVVNINKIELWENVDTILLEHPLVKIIRTYGIGVEVSPTLSNYIRKERTRQILESTPYPAPPVVNEGITLFGRCSPGTNLLCTKDFYSEEDPGKDRWGRTISRTALFKAGSHYLVANTGGEGIDQIQICTDPIVGKANISLVGAGKLHSWTEVDPPLEGWFDDSETVDFGQTIDQRYPERVKEMQTRIESLKFVKEGIAKNGISPLYKHVSIDASMEALKRGVVNCKLMRLGKSSEAITIIELWGSKKVALIGSKNVRLAFKKEFERLGFPESDYVFVNKFSDLDKPGKYYLFTMDWLKEMKDSESKNQEGYLGYLKHSERKISKKCSSSTKPQNFTVYYANYCPHCKEPLERPILRNSLSTKELEEFDEKNPGKTVSWTTEKGYICRNKECSWIEDHVENKKKLNKVSHDGQSCKGTAWEGSSKRESKKGSYIDVNLARHSKCDNNSIKGRQCQECGLVNSSWVPPRYRRVKDLFTAVAGDEIHNAKDINTQNARAMYSFRARRRIALTGTLLSNSPLDAYWPIHWAMGKQSLVFPWSGKTGRDDFKDRFCDFVYLEKPTGEIDPETGKEINKIIKKQTPFLVNPPDWWKTMQPIIVRRNYSDPLFKKSLIEAGMKQPIVNIHKVVVPMDYQQSLLYKDALQDFKSQWDRLLTDAEKKGNEVNKTIVIAKMSALRTIATVPERMNQKFGKEVYTGPVGGGKMFQIKNLIKSAVEEGKKVFIISDFVEMQVQLEKILKGYNPVRMIPSWGDSERLAAIDKFNTDETCHVCIASTRSVRESIDLSVADVTICCDLLWSPAWQMQAWSRTMAPTQRERSCDVYLLLSENSLDDYVYTVFYSKMVGAEQALDRKVMQRRAVDFDVKFFVQQIIADEEAISLSLRVEESNQMYIPVNNMFMEERV